MRIIETSRARGLRGAETDAEDRLWQRLRGRRLNGFKFVRQFPIGIHFADFCCRDARLIVEVDGATHSSDDEIARDARRTAALAAHGYALLRVTNADVFENMEGVFDAILAKLEGRETL